MKSMIFIVSANMFLFSTIMTMEKEKSIIIKNIKGEILCILPHCFFLRVSKIQIFDTSDMTEISIVARCYLKQRLANTIRTIEKSPDNRWEREGKNRQALCLFNEIEAEIKLRVMSIDDKQNPYIQNKIKKYGYALKSDASIKDIHDKLIIFDPNYRVKEKLDFWVEKLPEDDIQHMLKYSKEPLISAVYKDYCKNNDMMEDDENNND